jgi:selenoprotein W-related protein
MTADGGPSAAVPPVTENAARPRVTITYCTQCNWLLRAAWLAQELLQTFGQDVAEVALIPGTGGVFEIRCFAVPAAHGLPAETQPVIASNSAGHIETLLWERKRDGGFPEAKILKQRLRDQVWPERGLGHSDR